MKKTCAYLMQTISMVAILICLGVACKKPTSVVPNDCITNPIKSRLINEKGIVHKSSQDKWYVEANTPTLRPLMICGQVSDDLKIEGLNITFSGEMQVSSSPDQGRGFAYVIIEKFTK